MTLINLWRLTNITMYILGMGCDMQYQIFSSDDQNAAFCSQDMKVESYNELELTQMSSNAEEYDNIPWRIKEDLGYPNNYYQLSYEQQVFIDYLLDKVVEISHTIERLEEEIEVTSAEIEEDQKTLGDVEDALMVAKRQIETLQKQLEKTNI